LGPKLSGLLHLLLGFLAVHGVNCIAFKSFGTLGFNYF
jgi:hypothetical protein